jgi:hypothetical protein
VSGEAEGRERELLGSLRAAGTLLVAVALLPIDTQHDGLCWAWQAARDLRLASVFALAAPALAGFALIALSAVHRPGPARAIAGLGVLAMLAGVAAHGVTALAWDLLPAPLAWGARPGLAVVAVALVVTAVRLRGDPMLRRRAWIALGLAGALGVAWAASCSDLGTPLDVSARAVVHLVANGNRTSVLGGVALAVVTLWPLVAVALGGALVLAARGRAPSSSSAGMLIALAAPLSLSPFVQSMLDDPFGARARPVVIAAALCSTAAAVIGAAGALGFLARAHEPRRRVAGVSLAWIAVALGASLAMQRAARPRDPPLVASLAAPTDAADELFGAALPAWNAVPQGREAAGALVSRGRALGDGLGDALAGLTGEDRGLGLAERRWYARVERVNAAAAAIGLPYYVEPSAIVVTPAESVRRWLRVDAHRIVATRSFVSEGTRVSTLHLRGLRREGVDDTLGRSRDVEPHALIALDEIDAYAAELERLLSQAILAQTPPSCAALSTSPAVDDAVRACGAVLAALAHEGSLVSALVATTERHEVQHRLDGAWLPRSCWLDERLGLRPERERRTVQRELRAYLAQAAGPDPAPRLTLVRLARLALVARRGPDRDAASLALSLLSGTDSPAVGVPLLAPLDDAALRARARAAFRRIAGVPLAEVQEAR